MAQPIMKPHVIHAAAEVLYPDALIVAAMATLAGATTPDAALAMALVHTGAVTAMARAKFMLPAHLL